MATSPIVPYPPLEKLGLIGDRRTAALVAADGSLCWMCLPTYDGVPTFGALLDAENGGVWKLGPKARRFGRQHYPSSGPILETTWSESSGAIELWDFMPWPGNDRQQADAGRRVVVRRLHCTHGDVRCRMSLSPRDDFADTLKAAALDDTRAVFRGRQDLGFWCSMPFRVAHGGVEAEFDLCAGEELWCAFGPNEQAVDWTTSAAAEALRSTRDYWDRWQRTISYRGVRRTEIVRSAVLVHLLSFAPTGAVIASPTTSLPERIGGDRNYDYRLAWIRDASLGLGFLAKLGLVEDVGRFLHWLVGLQSASGSPLQVLYRIDGNAHAPVIERDDIQGYRQSKPVRFGNAAAAMTEIDSFGYLADCALIYLEHGGRWEPEYWALVQRIADFTAANWQRGGSSIWELRPQHRFVASRVMSWVTLDRALQIAQRSGRRGSYLDTWSDVRAKIFAEVMTLGWSERLGAFRQREDADTLDAALLLIPIMGLLPARHPRVTATVERIVEHLEINGFLHRFASGEFFDQPSRPLGEEEGGFLMCSFWLAQVLAQSGDTERAEAILSRAEAIGGDLRLFAEGVDARNNTFLGNMPLMFSQVEYARAVMALNTAHTDAATSPAA
jgi:GH15 family glucan-1,4-alpha-glucosidase